MTWEGPREGWLAILPRSSLFVGRAWEAWEERELISEKKSYYARPTRKGVRLEIVGGVSEYCFQVERLFLQKLPFLP